MEYHIKFERPLKNEYVDRPEGTVSVYCITGEQIADRTVYENVIKPERGPAFYSGKVIARHSWCGYIGMFKTLAEAVAAIEEDRAAQKRHDAVQEARKKKFAA